jgi:putative PIN family toxin of toxin-antitoxin system
MTRIVLDTNVVVSAMLSRQGNEALALRLARAGVFLVCVSQVILEEYELVLRRPAFRLPSSSVSDLLDYLRTEALVVNPSIRLSVSPHDDDNRFLECAEAAAAQFVVTGNKRHFPSEWKGSRIVNARELLRETIF